MVKKYISISLIAFMAVSLAAPLFSSEDCDMPCCEKIEMSCCLEEDMTQCQMEMTSCDQSLIILLISGPKAQNNQKVDLSSNLLADDSIIVSDFGYNTHTHEFQNPSVLPPISFLTPLRI
ncbi:MAG: hypothetical protein H8E70_01990 [Candidatus Marinimicrobia bacterium]|nr:hypothetical protein [Candidatus Neomarinimicrobiota bacterium]